MRRPSLTLEYQKTTPRTKFVCFCKTQIKRHMQIEQTKLEGVKLITPPTNFEDFRGSYVELYNKRLYQEAGITEDFIQDDISTSCKHVLEGFMGFYYLEANFMSLWVIYLNVINNDPDSKQYKHWQGFTLSDPTDSRCLCLQVWQWSSCVYRVRNFSLQTNYRVRPGGTIHDFWNDPAYKIWWPSNSRFYPHAMKKKDEKPKLF